MPIFHFDTVDGETVFRDEAGTRFSGEAYVRAAAHKALIELAMARIAEGATVDLLTMRVRNSEGEPVLEAELRLSSQLL